MTSGFNWNREKIMKSSVLLSIGLAIGISIWMLSGSPSNAQYQAETKQLKPDSTLMKVQVAVLTAAEISREVIIQGEFEPKRRVLIRAETEGLVTSLPVEKGTRVSKGELLFRIENGARQAQLLSAKSDMQTKQLELKAMQKLKYNGLQAENQVKAAQANLAATVAEKRRIQLDIQRTSVKAPFSGILESRQVELGALIQEGDVFGEIVDNSILKAVAYVPQQSVSLLQSEQDVAVHLLDNKTVRGKISYLANVAESNTRSFRVEVLIPNPEANLKAGMSVELRITVGVEKAHFISPAMLTLDNKGQVGLKILDGENKVIFYPVKLVRNESLGVWVSGLPDTSRVISLGQNFVAQGEVVEPVLLPEVNL